MIQIAIPTYRRYDTVCDKTLSFLFGSDARELPIRLFVANSAEKEAYWIALRRRRWEDRVELEIGQLGIGPQRNTIHNRYPEGTPVVSLDDDIEGLYQRIDAKTILPLIRVRDFFEDAFQMLKRTGLKIWGIYPVDNPYFMDDTTTTDLRFICSCVYGWIADTDLRRRVLLNTKQDYERTCRYYLLDGGVLRFNWLAPKTRYYEEAGGLQGLRTKEEAKLNAHRLMKMFPGLVTINRGRKNDWTEVKLRDGNPKNKTLHTDPSEGTAKEGRRATHD